MNQNSMYEENKILKSGNTCYNSVKTLYAFILLSKSVKIEVQ
jgi:hypothetical protein